ncbi:MAG TPA: HupE/UreJ family protein [Hansschlegelia sp.]
MKASLRLGGLIAGLALLPSAAMAHPGHGEASGFLAGAAHPIGGLDHVLAMVMVGLFAYQLGGRALWLVPATFVLVMALGGALGAAGVAVPFVEVGIALSIIVLGAVVALGVKAPVAAAMGLVGLFAIFHGHAHGAEMPDSAAGLAYAGGFMLATALLHAGGVGLGALVGRIGDSCGPLLMRASGGLAAIAGAGILTGVL